MVTAKEMLVSSAPRVLRVNMGVFVLSCSLCPTMRPVCLEY